MEWTVDSFAGGQLSAVMAHTMLSGKAREKFLALVGEPGRRDDSARQAFAKIHGWLPPAELGEWDAVKNAYKKSRGAITDVWMFHDPISYAIKLETKFDFEKLVNRRDVWITLLTGLEHFGSDPSGDSCFVSTLQTGDGHAAEVHLHNHETGELDGGCFGSIANFIAHFYAPEPAAHDATWPWSAAAKQFDEAFEASLVDRPVWVAPDQLFARSHWLMDLPTGQKGFELARKLADAPTFAVWLEERARLAQHPVLAHYWILAHYFLGNAEACREAIAAGKASPGLVASALAELVERLLDEPRRAKLGVLAPDALAKLCEAVRKNAPPELLNPAVGAGSAKTRPASETATRRKIESRLAAGDDPWALIAEYPDDVDVHDLVLSFIASSTDDEALAARIEEYFGERTSHVYNLWPYNPAKYDRRFGPVVAAAFRSGLRYDADHPKAYAGITRTLGIADDDFAMAAFEQAIDELAVDDDRVRLVIEALAGSTHPRAGTILERAASRFFTTLDEAKERNAKRAQAGPTIDNLFSIDSHFAEAVRIALRRDDEIAVRVAEKTLERRSDLHVFGTELGLAVRVLARRGRSGCLDWARAHAEMVVAGAAGAGRIDDIVQANLTECAIAIARLAGRDEAASFLREAFEAERERPEVDLAVRGALLAGLLILDPDNREYHGWIERLLGNRTGAFWVFGVLRGIEEGRPDVPAAWILPHVYADRISLTESQTGAEVVQGAARRALAAIGAPPPPPFDDSDEFANRVASDELAAALLRPDRHRIENVFENIREKKVVHPDVVTNGGAVLRDLYAWSADDFDRSDHRARIEGLRAMILQGPAATPELATLLELPHIAVRDRGWVRVAMRYCGQEAEVRRWLVSAREEEVLAELAQPSAAFVAFPDLLAAHVVARIGERAEEACLLALERRLKDACGSSDSSLPGDPAITLLPFVAGSLGPHARERLRAWARQFGRYGSPRPVLERAASDGAEPLTHDWNEPLVVEAACVGASVRYRVELSLAGDELAWKSTTEGFYMYDLIGQVHSEAGVLELGTPGAARAFADLELRALSLRGFRRPAPAKARKNKKQR